MGTGILFDIQRSSFHDGPGIRTTLFFKGCPIDCPWCHNPESISFSPQLFLHAKRCLRCGRCVAACRRGAHLLENGDHTADFARCTACGECVKACPEGALEIKGREYTVPEILREVFKDRPYYESSDGGVTLSGGEPMAQFDFALALLKELKKAGIHVCLETCGVASRKKFGIVAPLVDMFLYDYKESDHLRHKELTGGSLSLVLSNLDFLYHRGCSITLRCPIVPGVNDREDHFRGIAQLCEKYPHLQGVELLPYHGMGVFKSAAIGRRQKQSPAEPPSEETRQQWISTLQGMGCSKAKLG